MDWKTYYQDRLLSADEAILKIQSGDRVIVGHAAGEPEALTDALVRNAEHFKNVELVHMVGMGKGEYCKPEYTGHFFHNSLFLGVSARNAVAEGRADFTPSYFSLIPDLFTDGSLPPDVALVQVSRPDKHGYVSLGISVDYDMRAIEASPLVIAQVNENMPRTMGDSFVHVTDITYFVEDNRPLIELAPPKITDVERKIGENCASLINDGDTLQLGIGSLPDAVLLFLKEKNDLGIHSEMISDGVLELIEAGVITNKKKSLHKDKTVMTFLMGTRRLYDYVDDNPSVYMAPATYVNNPLVIAQNDNFVSINACVQVDFTGQICSESVGSKQISAVGGQVDFIRGATMAKNGRAIIAMPSTAKGGKVSKIVPFLDEGAAVTTNRYDAMYIITEYGIARMRGLSLRDRARALINIAHPDFRDELKEAFFNRFNTKF